MQDLLRPHGGLTEPIFRNVPAQEIADFKKRAASLKRVSINDADLSSLYRIGDGGLSPLTGPMDQATWNRVLDGEVLIHAGKPYAWTIPIAFPVDQSTAASLKVGETVALTNSQNETVGTLEVRDIYPFDKARYLKSVNSTERTDHPGGHMVMDDPRDMLLGARSACCLNRNTQSMASLCCRRAKLGRCS